MTVSSGPRRALAGVAWAVIVSLAACSEAPSNGADQGPAEAQPDAAVSGLDIPVVYRTLDNGLKVVLSPDPSVPTATVAVYYNIGFRIEPRDRTGFAHLFEHMMFQGSENLGKLEFVKLIQQNGGALNGSTRFDFTNYYQVVPSHKAETVIWAEADRMKGLAITQENLTNQQGVVINEVKVNVLNQPYGGFPWLDMPQHANENWYNAHNFYGDLEDIEAATLADVQAFFDTFYSPNTAVVVVAGDIDVEQTYGWVERYFGDIPAGDLPPPVDISEPRQEREKRAVKEDRLAPRPALAFAYHVPERGTPEWYAMGLLDLLLVSGEDSLLHQKLVKEHGYTGSVSGGINFALGHMFNYAGPMLWTASLIHDADHDADTILAAVDAVIEQLRNEPVAQADIDRALVKVRSSIYDIAGSSTRFGLVDLLACFALFDDDPGGINRIETQFLQVTPELMLKTAQEYLRPTNRTILTVKPSAQS